MRTRAAFRSEKNETWLFDNLTPKETPRALVLASYRQKEHDRSRPRSFDEIGQSARVRHGATNRSGEDTPARYVLCRMACLTIS
jgi:hypothetical protein